MLTKTPEARPGSLEVLHDASIAWRYIAPAGHTLELCLAKNYWKNVLREVSQGRVIGRHAWNKIEIICEDGSWEADLRIVSVTGDLVDTRVIREWRTPADAKKLQAPKGYLIEHIPANGWRALTDAGAMVEEKLATEHDAIRAAHAHARKAKGD